MSKLTVSFVRDQLNKFDKEEISFSKFVEILNAEAHNLNGFGFFWISGLTGSPESGEVVVVQKKDFTYEKIKYFKHKQHWFRKNVVCWLQISIPKNK